MPIPDLTTEEAARLFIARLLFHGYDGALRVVTRQLEEGPPGKHPPESLDRSFQWYHSLSREDREVAILTIRNAIDLALFHSLVFIDGACGGYPLRPQESDFAIYLQVYDDDTAMWESCQPSSSVRINDPRTIHLHDLYQDMLAERTRPEAKEVAYVRSPLPRLQCDFNACGWIGDVNDDCVYAFDPNALNLLCPSTGCRVLLIGPEENGVVLSVEAVMERIELSYWSGWRARPDNTTWQRGRLAVGND